MTWIVTYSGGAFDLIDPQPETVHPVEVAHALSLICRFTGHVRQHYSVAQHCVVVSQLVPPEDALAGLLHDAAEAYVGDVSKPLKMLLPQYQTVEERVWGAVAARFKISTTLPASVKRADITALLWEGRDLLAGSTDAWVDGHLGGAVPSEPLVPWSAAEAEARWLARLGALTP